MKNLMKLAIAGLSAAFMVPAAQAAPIAETAPVASGIESGLVDNLSVRIGAEALEQNAGLHRGPRVFHSHSFHGGNAREYGFHGRSIGPRGLIVKKFHHDRFAHDDFDRHGRFADRRFRGYRGTRGY